MKKFDVPCLFFFFFESVNPSFLFVNTVSILVTYVWLCVVTESIYTDHLDVTDPYWN